MSARCCTGAALGRVHSPGCVGDPVQPAGEYITYTDRQILEQGGETWDMRRARNLREQRRFEIASRLFEDYIQHYGITAGNTDGVAKLCLIQADAFLDEMAKPPAETEQ